MTNIVAIVTVAGLVGILALLVYLVRGMLADEERQEWVMTPRRIIGIAIGLTMIGVGAFIVKSVGLDGEPIEPIIYVALALVGFGQVVALFSLVCTRAKNPTAA